MKKIFRKYELNKDFFYNETPELAYFIGFFMADGHMKCDDGRYRISFGLSTRDEVILNKFAEWICPEMKIYHTNSIKNGKDSPHSVMNIDSKEIITYLKERYKIDTKKTFNEKIPYNLNPDLMPHFVRGYFDGDGCATIRKNSSRVFVKICGGSYDYLVKLSEIIGCGTIYQHRNIFELTFCSNQDVAKFHSYIYSPGGFSLKRKKEILDNRDTNNFSTNLSDEEMEFIKNNVNTIGIREVAKHINRAYDTVRFHSTIYRNVKTVNRKNKYSTEELSYIINNYDINNKLSSIRSIAETLGKSFNSIRVKIHRLGLHKEKRIDN